MTHEPSPDSSITAAPSGPPRDSSWWNTPRRIFITLVLLTYAVCATWPQLMLWLGIRLPEGWWFVDIYSLLAASDAYAMGLDPYQPNPLDLFHAPHWYSDWWFGLHALGLSRADAGWLGAGIGLIFLLTVLRVLRPRSRGEALWYWLAVCSPPVLLGANRANIDLFIFAALALAGWLLTHRSRALQFLAPVIIGVMTGLKFYPLAAAAAVPFGAQSRRKKWGLIAFMAVLGGLLVMGLYDDVLRVRGLVAADMQSWFFTIGAPLLITDGTGSALATGLTSGLGLALLVFWWRRAPERPVGLESRAVMLFVLGTATMAGCFFVGLNYSYRLVFALLQLPLLSVLCQASSGVAMHRLAHTARTGLLTLFWIDGLMCLLFRLQVGFELTPLVECRHVIYAVVSWSWIAAILGLWVSLARPVVRELCGREAAAAGGL